MKTFILYITLLLAGFSSFAQPPASGENPKRGEKIYALYVAYMTKELQLTPDEAQRFWPVHKQFDTEIRGLNARSGNELDRQQDALNTKKKYLPLFSRIIGNERSNNFFSLDAAFREKMVQRLKQMRQRQGKVRAGGGGRRENMLEN